MINGCDEWELTESFLTMSNDSFFKLYGFNWIPPMWMQDVVRKRHETKLQQDMANDILHLASTIGRRW